jgi:hypothetical protein
MKGAGELKTDDRCWDNVYRATHTKRVLKGEKYISFWGGCIEILRGEAERRDAHSLARRRIIPNRTRPR